MKNIVVRFSTLMRSATLSALIALAMPVGNRATAADSQQATGAASACNALENTSFETTADHPAKVIRTRYGAGDEATSDDQVMYVKRSQSQGIPIQPITRLPVHCRVEGYIAPGIRFLIYLPEPSAWNEKVFYAACDGFCGEAANNMPAPGLVRGYATIATDGGHVNLPPFDGIWAFNNRDAEIDFGYRSTHLASQTIKAVAKAYYGRAHKYAYMAGFSKGGTAGVKSAQMYPNDFDGMLARAPVLEYQTKNSIHFPWVYRAVTRANGSVILNTSKLDLIHKTVTKVCDPQDGLTDGVIDDPRDCKFDPKILLCSKDQNADSCLDAEQAEALRKLYARPINAKGEIIYPAAQEYGSELDWPNFALPVGNDPATYAYKGGSSYLKYMAFDKDPGPGYDWLSFDPDRDGHKLDALKSIYDADSPDLRELEKTNHKLIVVHGWGDGAVSASMTVRWFEKMQAFMGGARRTEQFARLFLLPGVKHGSGGDGPDIFEGLQALENWVERGEAPDKLIARDEDKGVVTRTRPVYPYPQRARYAGKGSIDDAVNFAPFTPKKK